MLTDQEKIIKFLEYDFASKTYTELNKTLLSLREALAQPRNKGNIEYMGAMKKIQNDINEITPVVKKLGDEICRELELKHGLKFDFLKLDEKKTSLIVER